MAKSLMSKYYKNSKSKDKRKRKNARNINLRARKRYYKTGKITD